MKLGKLFSGITKAVFGVPVAIAKDVLTLGIHKIDHGKTFTKEKLEEVEEKLDEVIE